MAKKSSLNSVTPRGELVKYARELGLDKQLDHTELMRVVDAALETDQPRAFVDAYARENANWNDPGTAEPIADVALAKQRLGVDKEPAAAAERVAEVLDGALTDTAIGKLEIPLATFEKSPPCETFAVQTVADPQFYLHLPNLAGRECEGHLTRHVDLQLGAFPLARKTLTLLRQQLDQDHARVSTNRVVQNPGMALIWLLEQYGRAAGLE